MNRTPVSSTSIAEVGYDNATLTLEIAFRDGGLYRYFGVPVALYSRFMTSNSKGRFFVDEIKDRYRFIRLS
jgi:hypothetical protein